MESKKKMLVKVAFFLFLMGYFSATVEGGRRHLDNPNSIIAQVLTKHAMRNHSPAGEEDTECCNACACTLTWPHRVCFCGDIHKEACPSSCNSCVCEEIEGHGHGCYCQDVGDDDCYVPHCRY